MPRSSMVKALLLIVSVGLPVAFAFTNCSSKLETPSNTQLSSRGCSTAGVPASLKNPMTIDQTVMLINALPKPLTLDCFISALSKPLNVFAIDSAFSAQPAQGPENPRIFLIKNNFLLSVVPAGPGRNLLEMSEYINANESVKAELEFPIVAPLPASAPYNHILAPGGGSTNCRTCHISETRVVGFGGEAYSSNILRPDPFRQIPAATLYPLAVNCRDNAYRCAILRSIFVTGQARDGVFP